MIVALGFSTERREKVICNTIEINISGDAMNRFIDKHDIEKMLENYKYKIIGKPIDSVNTLLTEVLIGKNLVVKKATAYITIDGRLNIIVEQRHPIVRIINERMQNYYIDEEGYVIPVYRQYTAFTLVANGHIAEPFDVTIGKNIFPNNKDNIIRPNIIYDIYKTAKYIDENDFWRSQIQQIYINEKQNMILTPRVGSHSIILGKSDDIDLKFRKLKAMYRTFNVIGWNKYKIINLKYKDQVICIKR
jgi:cell division protein FtsQ